MHKSSVSVKKLVDEVFLSGDLHRDESLVNSHARALKAFKQKKADKLRYEQEISYEKRVGTNLFDLTAKIDAIDLGEASKSKSSTKINTIYKLVVVNESLEKFEPILDLVAWSEVRANATLWALTEGLEKVNARVRWYHRDSMEFIEREEFYNIKELENNLNDLISQYLEWNNLFSGWPLTRDNSIAEFEFPFKPYRPGQREMMAQVYRSIRDEEHAMIEAPTGIGKTIGTLFPAIKALGEGRCEKIFYLTARTTGRKIALDALDMMRKQGLRLKYLEITSKEKICFRTNRIKECDDCPYIKDYYDRLKDALAEAFEYDSLNRSIIESLAEKHNLCPFEFSLDVSLMVDCIICDYNYAFDPRVSLERFFEEVNSKYVFLVDESHNLIDRSRSMFSCDITSRSVDLLQSSVEEFQVEISKKLKKLQLQLNAIAHQVSDNYRKYNQGVVLYKVPDELLMTIKKSIRVLSAWLELNESASYYKSISDMYYQLMNFLELAEEIEDNTDYCLLCDFYGNDEENLVLNLFCINPAPKLSKVLKRSSASIMFSATLKPFEYFRSVLGLNQNCKQLSLSSPFSSDNLKVEISPVDTTYKNRSLSQNEVVFAIEKMIEFKAGNYMVFFPSYAYMEKVFSLFSEKNHQIDAFIQEPNMSEEDREDFINRFTSANGKPQTQIAFAVMGGAFSEGIDLVGDKLLGVAIVGVGMPGLSIERDEIKKYYEQDGANNKYLGFEYSYINPGMTKVLQAAGRVIRSETDTGIVVLIDQRFTKYPYKNLLPNYWKITS